MLFFSVVLVLAFGLIVISSMDGRPFTGAIIFGALFLSVVIAAILWLVAYLFVVGLVTPSTQIVDNTATLLPVNLNDGKVALGYEIAPNNAEGKWYIYRDDQDEGTKYLFIEQANNSTDFGINAKLIDADKCKIKYIDDNEPCKVEYYHMEYEGFARAITKKGNDGITLYIHKNSMEEIWFPYSN